MTRLYKKYDVLTCVKSDRVSVFEGQDYVVVQDMKPSDEYVQIQYKPSCSGGFYPERFELNISVTNETGYKLFNKDHKLVDLLDLTKEEMIAELISLIDILDDIEVQNEKTQSIINKWKHGEND